MKSMKVANAKRDALFTEAVTPFEIAIHPWPDSGYDPKVEGRICYDETGLHVGYTIWENQVVISCYEPNEPVSRDSCVEFFVSPEPQGSVHYANFEINAIGTFLAKHRPGPGTFDFVPRSEGDKEFDIRTTLTKETAGDFKGPFWQVSYTVPRAVFEMYFPDYPMKKGETWRANFYKCGHGKYLPHQIVWNNIESERPGFHNPHYFGNIVFD